MTLDDRADQLNEAGRELWRVVVAGLRLDRIVVWLARRLEP